MQRLKERVFSLLKKTERYTRTDMVYLATGSFWLNLATGINTILSFIALYAFGNFVTPEIYGEYRYFFSLYGILTVASLSGFNSAITRAAALGEDGELIRVFKIQTLGSLLGTLGSLGIAFYYHTQGNPTLSMGFTVMGLALPLMESLDLYVGLLNGKKLFKETAIASIISQAFATGAILSAIAFHTSVIPLLATYFISWIAVKTFFFIRTRALFTINSTLGEKTIHSGFNISAVNVLGQIANQLDRIALFHYMGAKEVALYSFAIAPSEQIKGLFKNTNALIFPKFSVRSEEEIRAGMMHKMAIMGVAALLGGVLYVLAAPFIIGWFLPQYTEVIGLSQIYTLSLLGVMTFPPIVAMNSIPKIKALYLANIISPIMNIALILVLIPTYGVPGAIAAKIIGRIANVFTTYAVFVRS